MNKKLIFFDIDGTLLDHEKQIPQSTKQAIKKLIELGHELAFATGRAPFMFEDLREELNIHSYVSLNGQYVVHENKLVYENSFNVEDLHEFAPFAGQLEHPIIYESAEKMYTHTQSHTFIEEGIGSFKIRHKPIIESKPYQGREIYQSQLFCTEEFEQTYRDTFQQFEFVRWHEYGMDVLPKDGSKAKGIGEFMAHVQIPKEHVYAFGDALNDIEMLSFVENSIAMGNASDVVKKAAKFITTPVDEDGILKGLELVGLLEKKSQVL